VVRPLWRFSPFRTAASRRTTDAAAGAAQGSPDAQIAALGRPTRTTARVAVKEAASRRLAIARASEALTTTSEEVEVVADVEVAAAEAVVASADVEVAAVEEAVVSEDAVEAAVEVAVSADAAAVAVEADVAVDSATNPSTRRRPSLTRRSPSIIRDSLVNATHPQTHTHTRCSYVIELTCLYYL